MSPPILVTAFEPFGGDPENASAKVLARLPSRIAERPLIKAVLPVSFEKALPALLARVDEERPDIVLPLGEAGGRGLIGFERVAINLADARIADNDGDQPVDVPIVEAGPAAYFATLPVKAMAKAARAAGAPAEVSLSAGSFVCNALFYGLAHAAARRDALRVGFAHVPWSPEQARMSRPSLETEVAALGVTAALRAAVDGGTEDSMPGGKLH